MHKDIQKALSDQVNHEFFAAYQYFAMANHFEDLGLKGFSNWMKNQSKEEMQHAMKIYDYICNRNYTIEINEIKKPKQAWKDVLSVFNDAYEHEKKVTSQLYNLVDLSNKHKDHATSIFLQWFITEQVEEEALFSDLIRQISMVESNKAALYLLDKELGARQG